ncbi:unnamed protein product [Blepharisma stoltei]|uniref:Importin subunit alpha n=1 Tax=Blepharisma stoltei TaxID=1481888 RepID=A0AAU9IS23_9CILI|nr:unnamed protein product [Blepharisma stoltei]
MELMTSYRLEFRNKNYQKGLDVEEFLRKKDDAVVELRKLKRIEHINKKRRVFVGARVAAIEPTEDSLENFSFESSLVSEELIKFDKRLVSPQLSISERFLILLSHIHPAETPRILLEALTTLRKILSECSSTPFSLLVRSGATMNLIKLLSQNDLALKAEIAWCLINITSGPASIATILINQNIVPALAKAFNTSASADLIESCAWALGNLAGNSAEIKNELINYGVAKALVNYLLENPNIAIGHLCTLLWVLGNICGEKSSLPTSAIQDILRIIPRMLTYSQEEVLEEVCFIISSITREEPHIDLFLATNAIHTIFKLIVHHNKKIQNSALRTVGNIAAGSEAHSALLLSLDIINKLAPLLVSRSRVVKKEVLWILSNLAIGSQDHKLKIISHPCMNIVFNTLSDTDSNLKNEALWVVYNLSLSDCTNTVLKLSEERVLSKLIAILDAQETKLLMNAMKSIDNILTAGLEAVDQSEANPVAIRFSELGGLDALEKLQGHSNQTIYNKAVEIIKDHYAYEEIEVPCGGNIQYYNFS